MVISINSEIPYVPKQVSSLYVWKILRKEPFSENEKNLPRLEAVGVAHRYTCDTPCTDSSYGKCVYTYPDKDFRICLGIARNTEHWDNLYRHHNPVERTINLFKDAFGLNRVKTQNSKSVKFDLHLVGCTQMIGIILAVAIHESHLFKKCQADR